jgi:hypothetical protein
MNEWTKYTFVCNGDCDGLLEFTFRDGFGFPNGEVKTKCPCGSKTTYISMECATVTKKGKVA